MKCCRFSVLLAVFCVLTLAGGLDRAFAETGEDIAAWENFIRYYPKHSKAEITFQAIVQAASAPEDFERNLEYANLVDIESARYDEQTGELILIGPRLSDWKRGYLPPLLVLDDFVLALRVLDAVGERHLGVSIGTYNYGAAEGQEEQDARLGRQNVEYIPQMTAGTHMGFVLFEADRWLKNLSHGRDNHTLEPLTVDIPGYRTQPERARAYFSSVAASLSSEVGDGGFRRPYGLNWFLPEPPQVETDGYSMRFASYCMTVQYKAEEPDPEIAKFADHMTDNFQTYCREYLVFQELVRLHKLIQVAKWYRNCGFPDETLLDYTPLRIPTPEHTRRISSRIGRFNVSRTRYLDVSLEGGVNFGQNNVYVPSSSVPVPLNQKFGPPLAQPFHVPMTITPPRYGTYVDRPAPVPAFVAPIVQARPSADTYAWTVRVGERVLKAIAIPMMADPVPPE